MILWRYLVLLTRMLVHYLRAGHIPLWALLFGVVLGGTSVVKFNDASSLALVNLYTGTGGQVQQPLGLAMLGVQAFLVLVIAGAAAMRLFDPRRLSTYNLLDGLPITRRARFLIDVTDASITAVAFLLLLLVPASILFALRSPVSVGAGVLLGFHFTLLAGQVVLGSLAAMALALLVAPATLLRRRGALFIVFAVAFAPLLPVLRLLGPAFAGAQLPPILPGIWGAAAFQAALDGRFGAATAWTIVQVVTMLALGWAAYELYARRFLDSREEILAKLTERTYAEGTRNSLLGRLLPPDVDALLTKELRAFDRDPNLRVLGTAIGAFVLVLLGVNLVQRIELAPVPVAGACFLGVYLAASLGLSSFSQEGPGFPMLASLPVRPSRLILAKALANTILLMGVSTLAGAACGFVIPASHPLLWLAGIVGLALAGALAAAPLGLLVTLLGALFSRQSAFGRRIISPWAMGFLFGIGGLGAAALVVVIGAGSWLGPRYAVAAILATLLVGAAMLAGVVRLALRAVTRTVRGETT